MGWRSPLSTGGRRSQRAGSSGVAALLRRWKKKSARSLLPAVESGFANPQLATNLPLPHGIFKNISGVTGGSSSSSLSDTSL